MTLSTHLRAGASLAAILVASGANADVTAAEVWANWKENIAIYGEDGVTIGDEVESGGTVTVSGLAMNFSEDGTNISADMGELVFTENGDGTVDITMADSFPIVIDDGADKVTLMLTNSGMDMTASGTPDALNYAISADQYGIVVDEIMENGEAVPVDARFIANGVQGNYTVAAGAMRDISYALSMASVDMLIDVNTDDETALISGKMNNLTATALMTMPMDVNFDEPENMFAEGFSVEGGYGLESADYIFDIKDGGDEASGSVSMGLAEVSILLNQDRIGYNVASNDLAVNIAAAEMPFPVNVSLGRYGIGLQMPLSAADAPEPFSFNLGLVDLVVNDEIWMMGDPAGQLPRDPLTIALDLTGEGRWFFDLLDPEQADQLAMSDMPGELTSLSLNDLTLRAVGAAVTGAGAFTFDNTDLTTFDGIPRPTGEVTVNIDGANRLIDTLVEMGLIPQDQAGMGRMMMGMFARTVGEDQLTSTLEINDQGHVLANGQRIQ